MFSYCQSGRRFTERDGDGSLPDDHHQPDLARGPQRHSGLSELRQPQLQLPAPAAEVPDGGRVCREFRLPFCIDLDLEMGTDAATEKGIMMTSACTNMKSYDRVEEF